MKVTIRQVMTEKQAREKLAEHGFEGIVGQILAGYMAWNLVTLDGNGEAELRNEQGQRMWIRRAALGHNDSELALTIISFFANTSLHVWEDLS
jgi:ammonia channel protein AmtB